VVQSQHFTPKILTPWTPAPFAFVSSTITPLPILISLISSQFKFSIWSFHRQTFLGIHLEPIIALTITLTLITLQPT